jgi:hypothetical protein
MKTWILKPQAMAYHTIASDIRSGHRFVDRSPSHFHPGVFHDYGIVETGTFVLVVRYDLFVSGLHKLFSMDEQSPHVHQKKFNLQQLIQLATAVH